MRGDEGTNAGEGAQHHLGTRCLGVPVRAHSSLDANLHKCGTRAEPSLADVAGGHKQQVLGLRATLDTQTLSAPGCSSGIEPLS